MDEADVTCACCGRTLPRRSVHELADGVYICRRCGAWVALLWRGDAVHAGSE
ncbi:hypothetical protein [Agromyces sp. Soil535]|uniref:hypothetical protein n=1 Tax=Agromyces sp. Soil535 TaxID=1736390 RepID=UPI000A5612FE|nr:hypothetical protein [Agromyces sp. Soil535]